MITIREITSAHPPDSPLVRDLTRVFRDARESCLRFSLDLHTADEDRQFLSQRVLRENEVWTADVDGTLAGFIAFARGWIHHLYVAPTFHRQGIGTKLLTFAQLGTPSLQLWAYESNTPAIRFYERHGFRIVERTDGASNEAQRPDVRMEWIAT